MKPSWTSKSALILAFVAIILVEGIVQAVIDLSKGERPQALELVTQPPSQKNLRAFETRLEGRSWSANLTRPTMQYAQYLTHRDLGTKGLQGQGDWLFYRPGTDFLIEPWPQAEDDPLEAITAFRDALAKRDIELLMVVAPGKASVYPDKLSRRAEPPGKAIESVNPHTYAFLDQLEGAGIDYVDLFELYAEARTQDDATLYYLEHDTHWSPEGLRLAAQAVANYVRQKDWFTSGADVYTEKTVDVIREGDVLRMVGAPRIEARFPAKTVECAQIVDTNTGDLYEDDPGSAILVLGDSFLRIYHNDEPGAAGFVAHLANELQTPLASIINDGGASTLVRQELARKAELLEGKKLVIWEFVERDLRFGTEGWKHVTIGAP
jgi:hypothetical protein